jgi:ADP-ribose pyrophosphatase YjhB (NUDIX family)
VSVVTVSARDLARWSESLAAIARTGMGFTENLYERERYEEVLHIAADIKAAAIEIDRADELEHEAIAVQRETDHFVQEWMESIGEGVPGYVTPKVAVGAIVGNEAGEILLVQRKDSGIWLYPTGWADVGYSPAEVAVKEVSEETGIDCEPLRLLGVVDGQRMGFSRFGMYMLLFHCRATVESCCRIRSRPPTSGGSLVIRCPRQPPAPSGGGRWHSRRSVASSRRPRSTRCDRRSGAPTDPSRSAADSV